jgi:hypothetical protein
MEQIRTCTHLSPEERAAIMLELHNAREDNRPCSIRAIARALNRNPNIYPTLWGTEKGHHQGAVSFQILSRQSPHHSDRNAQFRARGAAYPAPPRGDQGSPDSRALGGRLDQEDLRPLCRWRTG